MLYILTFCVSHGFMVCSKGGKRGDKGVTISIGTGILEKELSLQGGQNTLAHGGWVSNSTTSYMHLAGIETYLGAGSTNII